jgi:hypothetical protein
MANWILLGIVVAVFAVLTLMVRRQSRHGGSRWGVHADRANFESPPKGPWFKDGRGPWSVRVDRFPELHSL